MTIMWNMHCDKIMRIKPNIDGNALKFVLKCFKLHTYHQNCFLDLLFLLCILCYAKCTSKLITFYHIL